jgi:hypothetical protein
VKPPHSQGPVRISHAPTTITDIPVTVLDALRIPHHMPGVSALTLDEHASRSRVWAYYDWEHEDWGATYFDALDILDINGPVLDGKSWTFKESIYAPTIGPEARSRGVYATQREAELARRTDGPARMGLFTHHPTRGNSKSRSARSHRSRRPSRSRRKAAYCTS